MAAAIGVIGFVHRFVLRWRFRAGHRPLPLGAQDHLAYAASDKVFNLVYDTLRHGRRLEDPKTHGQDGAYFNALGADHIPDPTTPGYLAQRSGPNYTELHPEALAARAKIGAS